MAKSKGAKRGRKKKRVAAHIKEAAGKRAAGANSAGGEGGVGAPMLAAPLGVGRPKRPRDEAVPEKVDSSRKERDRLEATTYLSAWMSVREAKREAEAAGLDSAAAAKGLWKFNKNRQAWLLQHIFSEQEIDGDAFGKLCLYVEGLKGGARERVLAEAQEIISKHGPDEEEEETAAAREASSTPAVVEPAHETVNENEEKSVTVPSGYNSDSTSDEDSDDDDSSSEGVLGETKAVELPGPGVNPPPQAGCSKGFSFGFSSASTAEVDSAVSADASGRKPDGGSSDSSDDDNDDDDDEAVAGGAAKRPRKARAALTGAMKAAAKASAAAVMYERALQVAEVLS